MNMPSTAHDSKVLTLLVALSLKNNCYTHLPHQGTLQGSVAVQGVD